MVHLPQYEEKRLVLQLERDAAKTQSERNQLGQFATPTALALDIVAYAKRLLPLNVPVRFLDPAFGTGAFYSALLRTFPEDRIDRAEGFEIDPHYGEPALDLWAKARLHLRLEDFTRVKPPEAQDERFNLVVCNPPYVRHHHITSSEKVRLQHTTQQACGVHVGGLAGLYCYFLGLSHPWIADSGIAGWLIPSEFMDVKYGEAVKRYLLNQVTLLRIHRFDPDDVQFADALVSSTVVWFRKAKPVKEYAVEFTNGGGLNQPRVSHTVAAEVLHHEAKWTRLCVSDERHRSSHITLADVFTIKRGIATGANHFFILTPNEIAERGLPIGLFRPILPSPRYLLSDEIQADSQGDPILERRLFLLDCRIPEEAVKAQYPALWRYLETGKPELAERYLCKTRYPWYSQEQRSPSPFLCTYMGRSEVRGGRPFRFILNHSRATAANVYLLLYPKPVLARALASNPELTRKVWVALNVIKPTILIGEGRVYGGGLHKLEPKELGNLPADQIIALIPGTVRHSPRQLELFGGERA
jgi:adenine-specific DNA-methyltransferase